MRRKCSTVSGPLPHMGQSALRSMVVRVMRLIMLFRECVPDNRRSLTVLTPESFESIRGIGSSTWSTSLPRTLAKRQTVLDREWAEVVIASNSLRDAQVSTALDHFDRVCLVSLILVVVEGAWLLLRPSDLAFRRLKVKSESGPVGPGFLEESGKKLEADL